MLYHKNIKLKKVVNISSQTKNLAYYHVKNQPIRILDIPGVDNNTVNDVIQKIKFCGEEINKLKENIYIILYFLNCYEKRSFRI